MRLHLLPPARAFGLGGPRFCILVKGPCRFGGKGGAAACPKVEPAAGTRIASWRRAAHATNVVSSAKGLQNNSSGNEVQIIQLPEEPDDYNVISEVVPRTTTTEVDALIDEVRAMLRSMGDGEISVSAYDTAWVALVPRLDGEEGPQFPTTLKWIVSNQLPDGSWGDAALFSAYDRMTNTLACVVALTKWSDLLDPDGYYCKIRGLYFLEDNMWRLAEEDPESMPIGFEIAFPSLVETARGLGIRFP